MITQKAKSISVSKREQFFIELYEEHFPGVAGMIRRRGGSLEEAQDIFQDALIIFYEKSGKERDKIENEGAYLSGISRHLWYRRHHQKVRMHITDQLEQEIADVVEEYTKPSNVRILKFLEVAGKKCMELLKAFYYHNDSLHEIAKDFGFSGTRSATVQKYKCLEKVRDHVKEKEVQYADFLD